tara:strand:+ start:106 stop:384 length:279 start_codon:yes stop_codon:yes gene_type:complete
MLQMRQSMPNNIPCLRSYKIHPVNLPQMWVDCYPSEDTNDSEGGEIMSRIYCHHDDCPDKRKYGSLIYSISCDRCYKNKMNIINNVYGDEEE